MSSYLCFICHSTVSNETVEEIREKYREVVGIPLCPDSQLCYICCHILNKLHLFKTVCFKRSLEYPVLFSEKGTLYLQRNDLDIHVICSEDCDIYMQKPNFKSYHYNDNNINDNGSNNKYVKLEDNDFHEYLNDINNDFNKNYEFEKQNNFNQNYDFEKDNAVELINDYEVIHNEEKTNNDPFQQTNPEVYQNDLDDDDHDASDNVPNKDYGSFDMNNEDDYDTQYNETPEIEKTVYDNYQKEIEEVTNTDTDTSKTKIKKSKKPKKCYKKIVLSVEQQKSELEANRRNKKYIEAEFKCYNCALSFLFKDTHQAHMMRHEESNGEFQCPICTLRFATQALLRSHTTSHMERYKCTKCQEILKPKSTKTHPCGAKEIQKIACHLCGNLLKDANGLQQHLRRVHSTAGHQRLMSCGVCGERYAGQALRTHMIKHIKKKFPCDQCSSVFSSPYTLTRHKRKHSAITESHYCTVCGVSYTSRKSLLAHTRNSAVHQNNMLECAVCGRACPGRRALSLHAARVHGGREDHTCPLCPSKYTTRGALLRHIDGHNKPRRKAAVCHLCGNSFKDNNKLKRHLRDVCEKDKIEEEFSTIIMNNIE
ncbi:zinc finger and BTB domain-containing protein 41-like [Aricia agestis]|uniref:zinc finger and BTB domain-containing protein 41-like n=1 Tax=Aricia agestis TaxID=91739 RepID=UPI001C205515|nr:zinc finger and BTB domain-containing protein 41-like [Aricia agestis]